MKNLVARVGGVPRTLEVNDGETLLGALLRDGAAPSSPCGGEGSCGKCRVRLVPAPTPTSAEVRLLSADELKNGVRLACCCEVTDGCEVFVNADGGCEVLSASHSAGSEASENIAVDLGTTTVVAALLDGDGKAVDTIGEKNMQSPFGADVMSRIKYASSGGAEQLQGRIVSQIENMLVRLAERNSVSPKRLTVCGNTTMLHLLLGRDTAPIGVAPYTPAFLNKQTVNSLALGMKTELEIVTMPCISAFAGADLVAGMVANDPPDGSITMLLDLGTNAEAALWGRGVSISTSAAAGPAFEGANIRCGSAAVAGAVCAFSIKNGLPEIETVGGEFPNGICGSGLIDLAAALVDEGIISESGFLEGGEYALAGDVKLYASDVRELQLAKAAVAAAAETLLQKAGIGCNEVSRLLLGGGFGARLNVESAAKIGLIPPALRSKAVAVGNTALDGCMLCAADASAMEKAEKTASQTSYLNLSGDAGFFEKYIESMGF